MEEMEIEEQNENNNKSSTNTEGNNLEFILFLILILLIIGNQNTFGTYFQVFNEQVNKVNQILTAFSQTTEGLQNALNAPQSMLNDLN